MDREDVLKYAKNSYRTEPDYPWNKFPDFAALRHDKNNKWYGLLMNVNKEHWVSIVLDGSVPEDDITHLLDLSYDLTK